MKKFASSILLLAAGVVCAAATEPMPLENDSATAVKGRLLSDFSLTVDEALPLFRARYGEQLTADSLRLYAAKHYIEMKNIDGVDRVHRKSIRNLGLLDPARSGWSGRGAAASPMRLAVVDTILKNEARNRQTATSFKYRFSIDVPYADDLKGDTLRVWMPLPFVIDGSQPWVNVESAFPAEYVVSGLDRSCHNTIYFQQPVVEGKTTHFEYVCNYISMANHKSPSFINAVAGNYKKDSELYKKYTAFEAPHIVDMTELAYKIVGDEKNPLKQSQKVFEYIAANYPWGGAREYSTIECIPQYVVDEHHGDCGQVALLYISLMRSLGVPARWESGWMLHPGEKNLHDWAEVYFEGVGWVPVDPSFGIYSNAPTAAARDFYATGLDTYRLRANKGVCGEFFPPKRFIRSETVDSQLGEVETSKGNLFYPRWNQKLEIIKAFDVFKNVK